MMTLKNVSSKHACCFGRRMASSWLKAGTVAGQLAKKELEAFDGDGSLATIVTGR